MRAISEAPRSSRTAHATALVVDGNATSRRFVELALQRTGAFVVEAACDAAAALDIMKTQLVDLVVADTDLPDQSGLAFHRSLCQESRLRGVPFIFLSADRSIATKVAALRAGADDYVLKPCDVAELVARAQGLVERQRRVRQALRERSYSLAGDFTGMAFPELVSTIEMARRSGVLSVLTPRALGRVYFEQGSLVHATYANLTGEAAFQSMFGESQGQFELMPGACPLPREEWTIEESATGLIMEAARVLDDERRVSGRHSRRAPVGVDDATSLRSTVPPAGDLPLAPPLAADTMLAAQLELALRDPFALGELRMFAEDDLERWTRRDVGRDRFHVVLVADLAAGVSSMLAMGGAPSERWVLDSLTPSKKVFGLTFFLRHERTVDVVLLDARNPTGFLPSLGRMPSVVLFCPPDGDIFSLGIAARVDLDELFGHLCPPAIVGVGNSALEQALGSLRAVRESGSMVRCAPGALGGDGAEDLRGLLTKCVRLWASTGTRPTLRPGTSREAP